MNDPRPDNEEAPRMRFRPERLVVLYASADPNNTDATPTPKDRYLLWHDVTRWCAVESTNSYRSASEREFFVREFEKARNEWLAARRDMPRPWDTN